jgi:hypothetical protein
MAAGPVKKSAVAPRRNGDFDDSESDLPGYERNHSGDDPDGDRSDHTCPVMIGKESGHHAGEERQRVNSPREEQPAKRADAENAEDEADDDHGGGLRDLKV